MKNEPLVSIIVLTYNSENTIVETLNSIYNQSYRNIELIVSDDCSTDKTIETVKNWTRYKKNRFSNIKIMKNSKNEGPTINANKGIKGSNGEYIKIFAADDILLPNAVNTYLEYCTNNNTIYFFDLDFIGNGDINKMHYFLNREKEMLSYDRKRIYKNMLINNFICGPSLGLIKRSVYKKTDYYDERFKYVEDYPFLIKLLENKYELKFINIKCAQYRIHNNSLCQNKEIINNFKDSMDLFFNIIKKKLLLKNHQYITYLKQSIYSYRYNILKKEGKTTKYKVSVFLYIIFPKYFIDTYIIKQ